MESVYSALSAHRLWGSLKFSDATTAHVTELWLSETTGKVRTEHLPIPTSKLLSLAGQECRTKVIQDEPHVSIFRVVWVEQHKETMQMDLPTGVYTNLLRAFGLQFANNFFASQCAGVTEMPPISSASAATEQRTFAFSYHPKLAVLWSHTSRKPPLAVQFSTDTIVMSTKTQIAAMKKILSLPWERTVASHAMFPLLLCSLLLSEEITVTQEDIKVDVREVEVRTGYHRFENRHESPAVGELGRLSASMSGCETKLASVRRKIETIQVACKFMRDFSLSNPDSSPGAHGEHTICGGSKLVEDRLQMQSVDNDYIVQRVRVQTNALFNLIGQHDSLIGLKSAQAAQLSAVASQRDSSSMKTLAIVTMLFLPGSFVSGLFSIDFFEWDADSSIYILSVSAKPGIRLYWAVAIPLTVVIFLFYGLWMLYYKTTQKRLNLDAEREITRADAVEEVRILSLKRETLQER